MEKRYTLVGCGYVGYNLQDRPFHVVAEGRHRLRLSSVMKARCRVSEQWYYTTGGQQAGPVNWDDLLALAAQRKLAPTDHVWNASMSRWEAASSIPSLIPAPRVPPLPPPLPPAVPGTALVAKTQKVVGEVVINGWYVKRNDQKTGPYSSTQLVEMAKQGQVLPLDWVARGEGEKWMPASQVKGLFPAPAAVVPPSLPTAIFPPLPASVPVKASDKLLGVIPARIAPPVIGMFAVVLLALLVSFFTGSLLVFCFSFVHISGTVVSIILAVRLHRFVYAPVAALLTLTVWGWYIFTAVPTTVSIFGLLVGISIGIWALLTFRSPDVKAMFADAAKPGPLDRFGTPVLAGAAGGLLAVILGLGGVLYMVARDKAGTTSSGGSGLSSGVPSPKRSSGTRKPGKTYLDDVVAEKGQPIGSYASTSYKNQFAHVWKAGGDSYDLVFTAINPATDEPEYVTNTQDDFSKIRLDAFLKGYRRK